jgi:hypothetical protein
MLKSNVDSKSSLFFNLWDESFLLSLCHEKRIRDGVEVFQVGNSSCCFWFPLSSLGWEDDVPTGILPYAPYTVVWENQRFDLCWIPEQDALEASRQYGFQVKQKWNLFDLVEEFPMTTECKTQKTMSVEVRRYHYPKEGDGRWEQQKRVKHEDLHYDTFTKEVRDQINVQLERQHWSSNEASTMRFIRVYDAIRQID